MIVDGNKIYFHIRIGDTFLSISNGYIGIETSPPFWLWSCYSF
nr:MAG TPA: hypothetical protein [Caudoviricetes sp.]